jgi:hypothetical protein
LYVALLATAALTGTQSELMRVLAKLSRKAHMFVDHLIEDVPLRMYLRTYLLQIPQHAGPPFHVMSGQYSTASRATVPR